MRTKVALVVVVQLVLVGVAVAPRLSAWATGEEYRLRVAGLDPYDPFRGAYVQLDYPDLPLERASTPGGPVETGGTVFLPLVQRTDGTWGADAVVTERPGDGPYLACEDGWRLSCGIESWFAADEEALRLQDVLAGGSGTATVRVDSRGHAVLVDLDAG
jgi:uncharacterized membrane-anchored protein